MAANVNRAVVGDDKRKKKKLRGRRYCCVYKCHNQEGFDSIVSFYTFPSRPDEKERRQRWIQAVRRAGPDGESWQPNSNTRICSRHFSGNARSNIMHHPAYVPTIFPSAYRRTVPCDPSAPTERFQRWQKRPRDQTKSPSEEKVKDTTTSTGASHQLQLCPDLTDESISLELVESTDDQQGELLHPTVEEECQHEDAATSDTTTSTGASHQLQLCPDLTDESISLELVESTDDQQGEFLHPTVEEECQHEDAATSDTTSSTGAFYQLQLCPDLTDESISLELVESTDDQQGELLHPTVEEECQHEDAATSDTTTSTGASHQLQLCPDLTDESISLELVESTDDQQGELLHPTVEEECQHEDAATSDTTTSTGASHQLQLCPDLTDESISLELVESTDDQQGELLHPTVEEECQHEDAATSDTTSSTGASHQLQLCPDLTDESISLELVESTDDQQGELLHPTVEEECQHEDAATSDTTSSTGASHQLQLCPDLTDESISLELVESTDDQQGELLHATVEEGCQHEDAATSDTTSSTGASHQLQLCPDLTDESISLELVESTDDQQGELLHPTVEEECQHEDAATSDTTSSTGASHQLQLCPDLTDESISLELVESTDDQQGELLHPTVEEECQHEDAATSCSTTSAERLPSLLHHAVGPSARVCFSGAFDTVSLTPGAVRDLGGVCDNVFAMLLGLLREVRDKTTDVSLPNKVLIFLLKMKHGLPFSAIAVLFGIHDTTVSRIFHAVLGTLATAT
ncbi:uncharacterized protein LOC119390631 isoform X7 [Rhipicephalus sanguineus]|uniref:uncharacterized protein LOC119390631 isoform X4 n=1 Tax=Rhipicephalus sanguineus TaxID=34632 RepID=UPI0020C4132D|nr:uncharacterized protein LOC119390631 isoform X4 [Rhipicephalus sanguineus]XP_049270849.1 uncharacterized protein LOC119390631 isoform X7 [Rhipicephalus sanguineus]